MRYITPLVVAVLFAGIASANESDYGRSDAYSHSDYYDGGYNKPKEPCPRIRADCGGCPYGYECQLNPGSAKVCPSAKCVPKKKECVFCPAIVPQCPTCAYGTECVITQQTCKACAIATCQSSKNPSKPPTTPPYTPPGQYCVQCFIADPPCPKCSYGQECKKYPATCKECAKSVCEPVKGPYY
jgi:hypothetical protein